MSDLYFYFLTVTNSCSSDRIIPWTYIIRQTWLCARLVLSHLRMIGYLKSIMSQLIAFEIHIRRIMHACFHAICLRFT